MLKGGVADSRSAGRGDLAVLACIALAKLALHLATSQGYGIFRDELYYIACSERMAWGYVDHPPLSIALLWLARHAFGDSLLAIRLLAAVAGAGSVFAAGLIARELGGRRGAQVLAAMAVFFAPVFVAFAHFFSMNVFDLLFWTVLQLVVVRILQRDEPRLWILFGLLAGFGLQNKYSVGFLAFGLMVGLLLTPQRRHLASPWLWLGGALAVLIFLPHLWWQLQTGWPSLEFMANATAEKNLPVSPSTFASQQLVLLNPLFAPLWAAGLLALLLSPSMARVRALGWSYVAVWILFVTQRAKAYYLAPIYPALFAAGAVALERICARRAWRWPMPAATALTVIAGLALLPLALPVLPVEQFLTYQAALGLSQPQMERNPRGALPQQYADMHGWRELVDTVGRVADRLPPAERARAVVLLRNYGEAGAVEFLGKPRGLPRAISGHNNYWLWGPGEVGADDPVIVVGLPRERLQEEFVQVERVDTVRCTYCMPYQNDLPVHLARGMKSPLAELWQQLKRFI